MRADQLDDMDHVFIQLSTSLFEGRHEDATAIARRVLRAIGHRRPDLLDQVSKLMAIADDGMARSTALHRPVPVDSESRLELLRREEKVEFPITPTWPAEVESALNEVIRERKEANLLRDAGLSPTRSLLFVGPPGVGKTLAGRWLASRLERPLLTLDLAAVMSSFLGKTGNNIRVVLDYAKGSPSILLLDEFDAIAKRRDDSSDVGELKRLVTVLLQAVDEWPPDGILIAATNHPELLDSAVWRRFEKLVEFPFPTRREIESTLAVLWGQSTPELQKYYQILSSLYQGKSFADVSSAVIRAKRQAVLDKKQFHDVLADLISKAQEAASFDVRMQAAKTLRQLGYSQRNISGITGLARATLKKYTEKKRVVQ
jgi:SpoVK/Ycf46/Vps4 family AAA+-type ATPase